MTVVDGATGRVEKVLRLATHPSAIAVSPKTNRIYIGNQTASSVQVLDGETAERVSTIQAGTTPYAMAVNDTAGQVYVANLGSADVTMIDAKAVGAMRASPPKFPSRCSRGGRHCRGTPDIRGRCATVFEPAFCRE